VIVLDGSRRTSSACDGYELDVHIITLRALESALHFTRINAFGTMRIERSNLLYFTCFVLIALYIPMTTNASTMPISKARDQCCNPNVDNWQHRPIFLSASNDTQVHGIPEGEALPLGVPFEFETPLFKGQMLVRLRNAKSDDSQTHQAYFNGRKRLMQFVIQGRFKKKINMADLYVGSVFREPMKLVPPPSLLKIMQAVIRRTAPGAILDLASQKPKVATLYASSVQSMSIDRPGEVPDITAVEIHENVGNKFGKVFKSIKHRKHFLSTPKTAAKFDFDTEHIYTLHTYDHAIDYGTYTMHIPMYGEFDVSQAIGAQPLSLSATTTSGETLFHFDVWHESVYRMRYS